MTLDHTVKTIAIGSTIKMLGDNRIGGYLIRFTDATRRDLDNEYFDKHTDIATPHKIVGMPILFHHGFDSRLKDIPIGEIDTSSLDEHGLWVEGILKDRLAYEKFVAEWYAQKPPPLSADDYDKAVTFIKALIRNNRMGWSSGANPNTAHVDDSGHIKKWSPFEASATHTPAEPEFTKLQTLKSIVDMLPKEATPKEDSDIDADLRGDVKRNLESNDSHKESQTMNENTKMLSEEELAQVVEAVMAQMRSEKMGDDEEMLDEDFEKLASDLKSTVYEQLKSELTDGIKPDELQSKMIDAVTSAIPDAVQKALDARQERDNKIKSAAQAGIDKIKDNAKGQSQVGSGNHKREPQIEVYSKFRDWSAEDFSFAIDINRHLRIKGHSLPVSIDEKFMREYADKTLDGYKSKELNITANALKSAQAIKADEVMYSTQVGFGDEHVPTVWRDQIWRKARRDNVVLPLMQVIEMPSNPFILPVESTDPTVYYVPETNDQSELSLTSSPIPDSKVATTNVTLTAGKLGLLTFISGELAEDSVSGAIPMYRAQAERAMMDSIDNVLLNGDTASSGNINLDGGTPGATAKYTIFNALLKNAIVTASTNAVDAGANSPTLSVIRNVRFKLDRSKQTVNQLAIIAHPEVENKLLNMDEFVTMDKAGNRATNMTGQIGLIDGIPVFITNEIALSDADGKITDGGNVVSRGRLLIVNRPSWYVGYRRNITTTLEYRSGWDAWTLTSTMRLAFISQDNDSVSVLYNIGV